MKLISFLLRWTKNIRYSRLIILSTTIGGLVGGVGSLGLLAILNHGLSRPGSASKLLIWEFVALCAFIPAVKMASQIPMMRLSRRANVQLRMQLCRQILAAPLRHLEQVGPHRILASLTDDIPTITGALGMMPSLCLNFAMLIAFLIYLGRLSSTGLIILMVAIVVGVSVYLLISRRAKYYSKLAREEWDALLKDYRALTTGTKELKLHRERRQAFLSEDLNATSLRLAGRRNSEALVFMFAGSWGTVFGSVLLGLIVFGLPQMGGVDTHVVIAFTFGLIYVMGPVQSLIGIVPSFTRMNIALNKVEQLGLSLTDHASDDLGARPAQPNPAWSRLRLNGVTHSYYREAEDRSFLLGPIDLDIHPGELIFCVGGNGSGKTTLVKLLTGLYAPEAGEIYFDDLLVTDENRDEYRQHFSVVFSDFFLFESLLGLATSDLDEKTRKYISQLQLDRKVQVQNGRLSTIDLSQGQRKRLALLTAFLEDRSIYIFDEWAADQDPMFKDIFYLNLLPELKAKGKTIIVISHDDKYYYLADRIVKLDSGQLEFDKVVDSSFAEELKGDKQIVNLLH
jgi:putative pyoverdin transport system ATP-binding/permease protein